MGVSRRIQGCFMKVSWKKNLKEFQGCFMIFKGVSRVFQGCFKTTFKVFKGVSQNFQGCFKKV